MFNSTSFFAKQFVPTNGGFLYYPSRKIGAKLITAEEHEKLVADWERVVGKTGWWKLTGLVVLVMLVGIVTSAMLALPDWTGWITVAACVAVAFAWLIPASLAPNRLVKGRPVVTPPRNNAEARRQARAALSWPFVLGVLLVMGVLFYGCVTTRHKEVSTWVWLIGSGTLFVLYVGVAARKLRD